MGAQRLEYPLLLLFADKTFRDCPATMNRILRRGLLSPLTFQARCIPVKNSTGLTGLPVVPNSREVLIKLYDETLKLCEELLPEGTPYRYSVEKFTKRRKKICEEEKDWRIIEKRINAGQMEELIQIAEDELKLIPVMAEWQPWEPGEPPYPPKRARVIKRREI